MTTEVTVDTRTQAPERGEAAEDRALDTSALFLDGVLIDLGISYWRGKRPLSAQDLGVEPEDVPEIFSLGRKLVIPKEAVARFDRVQARAYYLIDQFTFPFPTGRSRFVPYSVLPQVLEELKELRGRFEQEIDRFLDKYDEYRQQMVEKYPEHREALERGYTPAKELRKRFHFTQALYEVSLPKNIRFKAVDERDARADADARRLALVQAEESYRKEFQAQIDQFLSSSVGNLRATVGTAVVQLAERIKKGDLITKQSLDTVRRAIDRFRDLNFAGDSEVESKLTELEALMPTSKDKFNEAEFKQAFQTSLDSALSTITESDISKVTGEYKRRVRL